MGNLKNSNLVPEYNYSVKWIYSAAALLVLLVIITYSGATKNNFVYWDDTEYVINNKLVRTADAADFREIFSTVVSLNYHPLTVLSLNLNDNTCSSCPDKISAKPFILTNIFLHLLNTILVLVLIYLLFNRNLVLAFLVAAVFAVHPMHVESVAWVSARKDVLNSFFFLSGLVTWFLYLKADRRRYLWLTATFVLFILACLSKATAVVFPLILILIHYLIKNKEDQVSNKAALAALFSRQALITLIPFFAASLFFGLMAVRIQSGENFLGMLNFMKEPDPVVNIVAPFSWLQRAQIACYGFFVYLIKFVYPANQSAFYPYPGINNMNQAGFQLVLWISLLAFMLTFIAIIMSAKKRSLFLFCFGFYLINLLLVLQFISVGKAIVAERYTYLPYIGLTIIPAWYISNSNGSLRRWLLLFSAGLILVLALLARKQVGVWYSAESLWTQTAENHPDQELPWRARGKYYYGLSSKTLSQNERKILEDKALADFRMAITHQTRSADVYEAMGVILQSRNDFNTALGLFNIAVKLNPENGRTYYNRAILFDQMNKKEEAINDYVSALTKNPEMALAVLRNRSLLYLETGAYEKAFKDLNDLIRIGDKSFIHYYNRAFVRVMLKDYNGAVSDYQEALKLNPGDKETIEHLRVLTDNKMN